MDKLSLAELTAAARASDGPGFPPPNAVKFGGVDPLGLRQLNFNLMDEVLPALNNVARHIRPFVIVAWAWRRAIQLAQSRGLEKIPPDNLPNFVDRIEVIYVWSELLKNTKIDLPGRQALWRVFKEKKHYKFDGASWKKLRDGRRYSTALSAPVNYGPGLKMLGWVERHPKYPGVLIPTEMAGPALDAFEGRMAKHLDHPVFKEFGSVTVTADEAIRWQKSWAMDKVTPAEAKTMAGMLFGTEAPKCRQLAGEMILKAVAYSSTSDSERLRRTMAGPPSKFTPPEKLQETWKDFRTLQVRQLFRLSLEALFYWMLGNLHDKPRGTYSLVESFIAELKPMKQLKAGAWLKALLHSGVGPTELMTRIVEAMDAPTSEDIVPAIAAGLASCLLEETPSEEIRIERHERLPLSRARAEVEVQKDYSVQEFLRHVFESWVLAQHVYWSIGRGLADARAQVRVLLRLKVILDEGGWTLSPGLSRGRPPVPTADRLHTVVSLAQESGLISKPSS
jgi:hypothetical protein